MVAIAWPLVTAMPATAARATAHPLHTSLAEIIYDPAAREIRISIRVFVDDLSTASAAYARSKAAVTRASTASTMVESPLLAYARASFVVEDRAGRSLTLVSCGGRRVGDLMWICFRAPAPAGPAGFRVVDRILFDLYADQINIVQAMYGGKKVSLLFTRGDGLKRLD